MLLGHTVNAYGIVLNAQKVEAIKNFPRLVKSFSNSQASSISTTVSYQNVAASLKPLSKELTKTNNMKHEVKWTQQLREAFQEAKTSPF